MSELTVTLTRAATFCGLWVAATAHCGAAIPELEPLAGFIGQWRGDYVIGDNPENSATLEQSTQWVLDGRFLMTQTTVTPKSGNPSKVLIVWGFDSESKQYTRSFFFSTGGSFHDVGTYNAESKTFEFHERDKRSGGSRVSTATMADSGTIRWKITMKLPGNEKPLDIVGTNRRQ